MSKLGLKYIIHKKNVFVIVLLSLFGFSMSAQVKIGDNHTKINAASLLELESGDKGLVFPRVALNDDLSIWTLNGGVPLDGMVIFNTGSTSNPKGLYCWYNQRWNLFTTGGSAGEFDELGFDVDSRMLYDDGDSIQIPSGNVGVLDSVDLLQQYFNTGTVLEGDIFYVNGEGLYIRNNITNATTITEAFIFVPALGKPGRILYANYEAVQIAHDSTDFKLGVSGAFYHEPDNPKILNVDPPGSAGNKGYYAFAVPNEWANPRIFLKVKNSADGGFYKLNNCWNVTREMEYDGVLYQVWALDVPMRESIMDLVGTKAQFMIE